MDSGESFLTDTITSYISPQDPMDTKAREKGLTLLIPAEQFLLMSVLEYSGTAAFKYTQVTAFWSWVKITLEFVSANNQVLP